MRAPVATLGLAPWQWGVLALAYVALFLLPAAWMWRKARADGDAPLTWALLVAVASFLGVLEYYHHRSILKRRAKRAARQQARDEERPR
ncbi:MAG TPA: hypothetical protein VM582_08915 [Candidatus Thermoplasmatota archaeon]|nr:hypothetical protein [Candidatus Thermoplasmatota archaeon]